MNLERFTVEEMKKRRQSSSGTNFLSRPAQIHILSDLIHLHGLPATGSSPILLIKKPRSIYWVTMDESMPLTSFSSDLTLPRLLSTCRVESMIFGGLPPVEMRGNRDGCMYSVL
jgi:hypothetical protein